MSVRVVVADGQPLARAGLALLLTTQPGLAVVGQAADGAEAVAVTHRQQPDVLLTDLPLPGIDGIAMIEALTACPHRPRVLVLTDERTPGTMYAAIRAGASGYLLKDTAPELLVGAVRAVAGGCGWLDPLVTQAFFEAFVRHPAAGPAHSPDVARLTPREREILVLIAQGLSNEDVARHLFVAECTVKTHLTRILMKLGSRDRAHAVTVAYRSGLVRVSLPPGAAALQSSAAGAG